MFKVRESIVKLRKIVSRHELRQQNMAMVSTFGYSIVNVKQSLGLSRKFHF